MKKIITAISLAAFLLFGAASVHTITAAQQGTDIVVFDKDPDNDKDKDKDKKAKKTADAKTADKKDMKAPSAKKDCAVKSDCQTPKKTSCCSKSHPDKK